MRVPKIQIPNIPEEEKTPVVSPLLGIIEQQSVTIQLQGEEIQLLKDEIARLKGQKLSLKSGQAHRKRTPKTKKRKSPQENALVLIREGKQPVCLFTNGF